MKKTMPFCCLFVFILLTLSACVDQQALNAQRQRQFDHQLAKHYCVHQQPGTALQPAQYYVANCYQKIIFPPLLLDIQHHDTHGKTTHQKFLIQTVQVKNI